MIFNLISSGLQQVELHGSCCLAGMGVRVRGGTAFKPCSRWVREAAVSCFLPTVGTRWKCNEFEISSGDNAGRTSPLFMERVLVLEPA